MPGSSIYEFARLCGRLLHTSDSKPITCPNCGRALVVEWRGGVDALPAPEGHAREPDDTAAVQ